MNFVEVISFWTKRGSGFLQKQEDVSNKTQVQVTLGSAVCAFTPIDPYAEPGLDLSLESFPESGFVQGCAGLHRGQDQYSDIWHQRWLCSRRGQMHCHSAPNPANNPFQEQAWLCSLASLHPVQWKCSLGNVNASKQFLFYQGIFVKPMCEAFLLQTLPDPCDIWFHMTAINHLCALITYHFLSCLPPLNLNPDLFSNSCNIFIWCYEQSQSYCLCLKIAALLITSLHVRH